MSEASLIAALLRHCDYHQLPDVLRLLRAVRLVKESGIDLSILAGSHDIRVLMGLAIDRSGTQSTKRALFRVWVRNRSRCSGRLRTNTFRSRNPCGAYRATVNAGAGCCTASVSCCARE